MKKSDCRRVWDARGSSTPTIFLNIVDVRRAYNDGCEVGSLQLTIVDESHAANMYLGRAQAEYLIAVLQEWLGPPPETPS